MENKKVVLKRLGFVVIVYTYLNMNEPQSFMAELQWVALKTSDLKIYRSSTSD